MTDKLKNLFNSNFFYCAFLLLFFYLVCEISFFSIHIINSQKKNNFLLEKSNYKFFDYRKKISLKYPRTITSMQDNLKSELITFERDELGGIYPSNFKNLKKNDEYFVFCGGSTLEASQVKQGNRPSDIFSKRSGINSLNFSEANQTLSECIKKIDNFNNFIKEQKVYQKPTKYVLSTNINSLSNFLRTKIKKNETNITFGSFTFNKVKKALERYKRNKYFGIKLSEYENAIIDGCCFAPSEVNSRYFSILWDDPTLEIEYINYLKNLLISLEKVRQKHNIYKKQIVFSIEPNSFSLKFKNFAKPYWRNIDSRQYLKNKNNEILNNIHSSRIIDKFDIIYADLFRKEIYKVLQPSVKKFPKWSFYDAVHYTDQGSIYLGEFFYKELILNDL